MDIKQIYKIVNTVTAEVLGKTDLVQEDLSNCVDVGNAIFDANSVDRYCKALVDHVGKVVFSARRYKGRAPFVLMDGWEYGAVLEKITCKGLPEAEENESWELSDGASYDPNIFYKPDVAAKFYNKRTTFEIPISFTDRQVRSAFSTPTQLNAFLSMIEVNVANSLTVKNDELIMRTINGMTADTIYSEYQGGDLTAKSGVRAVNLFYLFKQAHPDTTVTAATCLDSVEFLSFAAKYIFATKNHLAGMSELFNIGGLPRFTPEDMLHVVMHADFVNAANFTLKSNVFHDEYVKIPNHDTIGYWQGSGTSFAFADTSKINVKSPSGNIVTASGILCVMFDREALGVTNFDPRVTSHYNPKAEFTSNWNKVDAGYFNDENENFVVFFVA